MLARAVLQRVLANRAATVLAAIALITVWLTLRSRFASTPASSRRSGASAAATKLDLAAQVPRWVPLYRGADAEVIESHHTPAEQFFTVELRTTDHCTKVADWYQKTVEAAGYNVYGRFDYGDPGCSASFRSDNRGQGRSLHVRASGGVDDVSISIESVEREGPGATVALPEWVPVYPGAT